MFSASSGERCEAARQATTQARMGDAQHGDQNDTARPTGVAHPHSGLDQPVTHCLHGRQLLASRIFRLQCSGVDDVQGFNRCL